MISLLAFLITTSVNQLKYLFFICYGFPVYSARASSAPSFDPRHPIGNVTRGG